MIFIATFGVSLACASAFTVMVVRSFRQGFGQGVLATVILLPLLLVGLVVNPISNLLLGSHVRARRLACLERRLVGHPTTEIQEILGQPDRIRTNDNVVTWEYWNTSPWWEISMFPFSTLVDTQSNRVTSINELD